MSDVISEEDFMKLKFTYRNIIPDLPGEPLIVNPNMSLQDLIITEYILELLK